VAITPTHNTLYKMITYTENDKLVDQAITKAEKLGKEHGESAAQWIIQDSWGGRVSSPQDREAAKAFLDGAEAGDPAIMDKFSPPNLSGEWADSMTEARLMDYCLTENIDWREIDDLRDAVCQAYEQAASDSFWQELETSAANLLEME
jgi:hypothetical protein